MSFKKQFYFWFVIIKKHGSYHVFRLATGDCKGLGYPEVSPNFT